MPTDRIIKQSFSIWMTFVLCLGLFDLALGHISPKFSPDADVIGQHKHTVLETIHYFPSDASILPLDMKVPGEIPTDLPVLSESDQEGSGSAEIASCVGPFSFFGRKASCLVVDLQGFCNNALIDKCSLIGTAYLYSLRRIQI